VYEQNGWLLRVIQTFGVFHVWSEPYEADGGEEYQKGKTRRADVILVTTYFMDRREVDLSLPDK
jgi:hypothetical protein